MNIKYLKNILDKAKECEADAVKVDIEEFASAVAWIENHESLPNEYADRLAEQSYQRGRADAIDAFIEELLKHKSKDEYPVICMDEWTLKRFAEKVNGETE